MTALDGSATTMTDAERMEYVAWVLCEQHAGHWNSALRGRDHWLDMAQTAVAAWNNPRRCPVREPEPDEGKSGEVWR